MNRLYPTHGLLTRVLPALVDWKSWLGFTVLEGKGELPFASADPLETHEPNRLPSLCNPQKETCKF